MHKHRITALSLAACAAMALAAPRAGAAEAAYILCTRGGQIAYYDGAARTWHATGVPVGALVNEADRAALERGLHVSGRAELTRALEDYCS